MNKKIILFIPSIEKVVEKFIIISNYLSNRFKKLTVISATKKQKKFNKRIEFLCPDMKYGTFLEGIKTIISILF